MLLCAQDDPSSPEYNVPARVDAFVSAAQEWSRQINGNDVLFMMGSDFHYANAHAWFINLDRCVQSRDLQRLPKSGMCVCGGGGFKACVLDMLRSTRHTCAVL